MIANLRWRSPAGQLMPEPSARLALIANNDGEPDNYGLELAVDDLATSWGHAFRDVCWTRPCGCSAAVLT